MKFDSPIPRYGILCTNEYGQKYLRRGEGYDPDVIHAFGVNNFYIFYYRAEAVQSLKETPKYFRKASKMKVVKLVETYTVVNSDGTLMA